MTADLCGLASSLLNSTLVINIVPSALTLTRFIRTSIDILIYIIMVLCNCSTISDANIINQYGYIQSTQLLFNSLVEFYCCALCKICLNDFSLYSILYLAFLTHLIHLLHCTCYYGNIESLTRQLQAEFLTNSITASSHHSP